MSESATPRSRHLLGTRVLAGCAVLFAAIAVSLMLSNCGGEKSAQSVDAGSDQNLAMPAQHVDIPEGPVATPIGTSAVPPVGGSASVESQAPDLAASTTDSTMAPGSTVEIVAEGTADVTDITLRDGRGDPQPFVYDVDGKVWTASYRVPLKPTAERIGLSVTARNDLGRWRRVWVFVKVASQELEPSAAEGDSTEGCE